jgi:hypothetical protein
VYTQQVEDDVAEEAQTQEVAGKESPKRKHAEASTPAERTTPVADSTAAPRGKSRRRRRKSAREAKIISLAERGGDAGGRAKYPRHGVLSILRIPRGMLDQNAGRECSDREAAGFVGVGLNGDFRMELSSATKYGLLERPRPGTVKLTDLARKILRPQNPDEEVEGLRQAALLAPDISDVYKHYRGENLPDAQYFDNALVDNFHMPPEKIAEFKEVLLETLNAAKLISQHEGKWRVVDVSSGVGPFAESAKVQQPARGAVAAQPGETCFVMMPFAAPVGGYYGLVYEPAIKKAGLIPVRADAEIFGTGKIVDQIYRGLNASKVLVAELTGRNPNVFYELGLAHGLNKPVVLVSSNEADVPFDLQHIRVIYYDREDPFWGAKLIDKIAENITFAMNNPGEATFQKIAQGA